MSYISDWVLTHRWAITPQALLAIIEIADKVSINIDPKVFHGDVSTIKPEFKETLKIEKESLTPLGGRRLDGNNVVQVFNSVGVIDVFGPIFPRSSSMNMSSPGITVSRLSGAIDAAVESREINSIILNVDSPGGEVTDIDALGEKIFETRQKKPIFTFVTGMAASAGYWIGSSASEIIIAKTGEVGSIGVVAAIRDTTDKDEKAGIKNINIVSSVSPKKKPDFRTEAGQADIKSIVDELGMMFVAAVARNRNTTVDNVIKNFGQGSMILSTKALDIGMVDRIGSLESLITELNNNQTQLIGGVTMSNETLVKNATIESIKAENPKIYDGIFAEGTKLSKETENKIKDEAFKAGAEHENARIKDVESLEDAENKNIISENKFNMEMTKEDVALVIIQKQKETSTKAAEDHKEDAENLGNKGVKAVETEADTEENAKAADVMAAAMNDKRRLTE